VLSITGYGASNVDVRKAIRVIRVLDTKEKRLRLKHQPQAAPHKHGLGIYSAQLDQSGKSEKQT
jgi:hypothetical protein